MWLSSNVGLVTSKIMHSHIAYWGLPITDHTIHHIIHICKFLMKEKYYTVYAMA